MTLTILFSAPDDDWNDYREVLPETLRAVGIDATVTREADAADVDYIVYAPNDTLTDFAPFTRTKAVLSLWAGVEKIVTNPSLTQPLCRMVDDGLALGMRDYVVGHVMRAHLGADRYTRATAPHWDKHVPPLARDRKVAVLGLGELGATCAEALASLGFDVHGWSRRAKPADAFPTLSCHHGEDGLTEALAGADVVVTLLPDTCQTHSILNADRLSALSYGAAVINPGRGVLIDDEALIAAIKCGQVGSATLDVFRVEPLPDDHPFWSVPQITITPHIAAATRPDTASAVIAENIKRGETGQDFLHRVDRTAGY